MRLSLAIGTAALLILATACSQDVQAPPTPTLIPTPAPTPTATPTPLPSPPATGTSLEPSSFDPQRALAHVWALATDIGPRPAGSEAEETAANYIAAQLQSWGYEVQQQPFIFEAFIDLGTTLEVVAPQPRSLEPTPLRPTISGSLEAEVVVAGLGRALDFPADAEGKVALIERGGLEFTDKVANAAATGAAAAIIYNNEPGPFAGLLRREPPIPAVSISQEEGQLILDLLAAGPVTVHLDVQVEVGPQDSHNVIGRPPEEDCQVYVGGHYDSVTASPGANDNASGTATVLELARALAADGELDPVCFLAFGAEEAGLFGSSDFVTALPLEERRAAIAMLNFDMVGAGQGWLLAGSSTLTEMAAQEADRLGLTYVLGSLPEGTSSDHASFQQAGIPAITVHRQGDPHYHTAEDRAQFIDPELLDQAGGLGLALIEALLAGR